MLDRRSGGGGAGVRPGTPPEPGGAGTSYRYELVGGVLRAATARGPDVDLVVTARGRDDVRCEYRSEASYLEALRSLCEQAAAGHPEYLFACEEL